MPQFDVSSFVPQLVWLAITFIGLYLIMSRVALPRIGAVLEERRRRIDKDLDEAEAMKREAEEVQAAYEAALAAARAEAQEITLQLKRELDAENEARKKVADEDLAKRAEAANAKIEASIAEAMKSVDNIAAEVATALVGTLLPRPPKSGDAVASAVASALNERAK